MENGTRTASAARYGLYTLDEMERYSWKQKCSGPFEDGKFFTRGNEEKPVCVKCEERRLKA